MISELSATIMKTLMMMLENLPNLYKEQDGMEPQGNGFHAFVVTCEFALVRLSKHVLEFLRTAAIFAFVF